jgi:hypothetical protein
MAKSKSENKFEFSKFKCFRPSLLLNIWNSDFAVVQFPCLRKPFGEQGFRAFKSTMKNNCVFNTKLFVEINSTDWDGAPSPDK